MAVIPAVIEPLLSILRSTQKLSSLEKASTADEAHGVLLPYFDRNLRTMVEIYPLLAAALFSDSKRGRKLYCEQILPMIKLRSEGVRKLIKTSVDAEFVCIAGFGIEFAIAMDRFFRNRTGDLSELARKIGELVFSDIGKK